MGGLPRLLPLFHKEFNKFSNTTAKMLDSVYYMALKSFKNSIFGMKTSIFYRLLCKVITNVIMYVKD